MPIMARKWWKKLEEHSIAKEIPDPGAGNID
jgi:hypothetical protein